MIEKKKKILIVDDEELIRNLFYKFLTRENFQVLQAKTGHEALEISLVEHPDLIMMDMIMPGMHGYEVIKILENDEWGRNVPILILTNFPEYPGIEELVGGKYEIISKINNKIPDLLAKINEKLKILPGRRET
ncbi:MAG: response regulator [Patescibacteria group bacterium]